MDRGFPMLATMSSRRRQLKVNDAEARQVRSMLDLRTQANANRGARRDQRAGLEGKS